jgi:hypothetical protein
LWRGEVRVVSIPTSIWLLGVGSERVLVLRAEGVGRARWVLKLFVVAEDEEEEESGETEFDEEGQDIGPSAPVPGLVAPCTWRVSRGAYVFPPKETHIVMRHPYLV